METIRELVQNYQNEILKGNLLPIRASEILMDLSALIGNINEEIMRTEMKYNQKLLDLYTEEETANRAKIRANITPEYEAMRLAKSVKDVAVELIRSLKMYIREKREEFGFGKNM